MKANHGAAMACLFSGLILALWSAPCAGGPPYVGLYGDTLGGIGGAERLFCGVRVPVLYTSVEMWIWFKPDPVKGLSTVEFKIAYPSTTYITQGPVTSNPLNQIELGSLAAGISVSVGTACQYDWYWSHRQEIIVKTLTSRTIQVVGHQGNGGHIYVGSCETGFPLYDAIVENHLVLNGWCPGVCYGPRLNGVKVRGFTSVSALFEYKAFDAMGNVEPSHFVLRTKSAPLDTLPVVSVGGWEYGGIEWVLSLGEALSDGVTYVLEALNVSNACCGCYEYRPRDSQWEFTFDASVGTRNSSWGAIKNLYVE